ncbi:hypothetical protein KC959_03405, partial [Candidatus Saccharibacteria bacterium]|nr:hypothetical protein [Candidatus Saccharibacteria bacterium]
MRVILHKKMWAKVRRAKKITALESERLGQYDTRDFFRMTRRMMLLTLVSYWRRHKFLSRLNALFLLSIILFSIWFQFIRSIEIADAYDIPLEAALLLTKPVPLYADKLQRNQTASGYIFNAGYAPSNSETLGDSYSPKIIASFGDVASGSELSVTDPLNNISIRLKPKFSLREPLKKDNRILYPIAGKDAIKVYSLGAVGVKEDIILRSKPKNDKLTLSYDLSLPDGVEARAESDGSIGVYGAGNGLISNVTASSENDQALLKKAREKAKKTVFLFKIPAPVVIESGKRRSSVASRFELNGNILTLNAVGLHTATYPLSIDPTIYVETAQKLMRGNNESNIDFDVNNELIQKSQTTGARIDAWEGNLGMTEGTWGQGAATAGGYLYRTGGRTGYYTKPQIVDKASSAQATNSTNFVMNMPTDRPADDLYIALMCHDGTATPTAPSGGNWTELTDQDEFAAYYKVGEDISGGDEASSYTWTIGSGEEWYGVIVRVTGFNSSDIFSGTAGTANTSGDASYPATTPDSSASLVIRAVGVNDEYPDDE